MAAALAHRGRPGAGPSAAPGPLLATLEREPAGGAGGAEGIAADLRLDNRAELLGSLAGQGHALEAGASDAAIARAAYDCWGDGCVGRLLGDFAIAIWDARRRRLFCARDLMGLRPLYYRQTGEGFYLASEAKALTAAAEGPPRLDRRAIACWLADQDVPLDQSFYEGIAQLPAGHALTVEDGRLRVWPWWSVADCPAIRHRRIEDYVEHYRELLLGAVGCRLERGGETGLLLSGGLDSGAVASAAGWLAREGRLAAPPLRAVCFNFEQVPGCDERQVSDAIVRHYGLPLTLVPTAEAWSLADEATAPDADDPMMGPYQGVLELACAAIRESGGRQLMTGQHGDMVAGCWLIDLAGLLLAGRWRRLEREVRGFARDQGLPRGRILKDYLLLPLLQTALPRPQAGSLRQWARAVCGREPAASYPEWISPACAAQATSALDPRTLGGGRNGLSHAGRARHRLLFMPLQKMVTTWSGRLAARHGLTHSDPWSDRRLVEFALGVPQDVFHRDGLNKWLTRAALAGLMPEPALSRAGKVSPEPFFRESIRSHAGVTIGRLLRESRLAALGLIEPRRLAAAVEAYRVGRSGDTRFMQALSAELWLRRHWG